MCVGTRDAPRTPCGAQPASPRPPPPPPTAHPPTEVRSQAGEKPSPPGLRPPRALSSWGKDPTTGLLFRASFEPSLNRLTHHFFPFSGLCRNFFFFLTSYKISVCSLWANADCGKAQGTRKRNTHPPATQRGPRWRLASCPPPFSRPLSLTVRALLASILLPFLFLFS